MLDRIKIIIVSIILLGSSFGSYINIPDVVTKVATCSASWLKTQSGIRGVGMGGAHVAVGDGI